MFLKHAFYVCMILLICTSSTSAQTDRGMNYQAVARDANGTIMDNVNVNLRFQIREGSASGTLVYQESHNSVMTNDFGLVNLVIGSGTPDIGNFETINWADADHFLTVELNGTSMGTSELLSVPYSKVATDMELSDLQDVNGSPSSGQVLKWNGSEWAPGNDAGGTNYQAGSGISISGNTIENTAPDQAVSISGSGATNVSGSYPNFTISSTDNVNDADSDDQNEIQMLNLSGSTLSLSLGGGSVALPNNALWNQTGNNIHYTTGRVGIGTSSPGFDFHLEGSSGNLMRIEHTATGSSFDLIEFETPVGFTGQFLEFQNGGSVVGRVNANGAAEFENVTVQEELNNTTAPTPGRLYADILPIAYGHVNTLGTILTEFGVSSVSKTGNGIYVITLNNSWAGSPVIIATTFNSTPATEVATAAPVSGSTNQFTINIAPGDSNFFFVVYGNPQ